MASPYALEARARKRLEAEAVGIDAAYVDSFVERFYARVRQDTLLGPIFERHVGDWPTHLDRMKRFWRSVLFSSGEFAGNPMLKHMVIPGIDTAHFDHWLRLFEATLREAEPDPAATARVAAAARMIADSLLTGIAIHRGGIAGARAGEVLRHA